MDAKSLGGRIPHVMLYSSSGWEKIDSFYADDTGVIQFPFAQGGTFYVAEGGDKMPPAPPTSKPEAPSESDALLDRICALFDAKADECRKDVEAMQDKGIDDLYIGRHLLERLEDMVIDNLKDSVATPARKRELLMNILDMLDDK